VNSISSGCTRIATDLTPQSAQLIVQTIGGDPNWPTSRGATGDVYLTQTSSPLINAIPSANPLCGNVDQRKIRRNKGITTCDIGAVERSNVLFVQNTGGTTAEQDWDTLLRGHFTTLGFAVTTSDDDSATTSQASGQHIVFISESVDTAKINTKYRDVTNTVVIDEPSLYGQNRLTGTGASDAGDKLSQTSFSLVNIDTLGQPMGIMGYSTPGTYSLTPSVTVGFGIPAAAATKHAMIAGSSTEACIFSYATGQAMPGSPAFTAPGPRVGYSLQPGTIISDDARLYTQSLLMAARL
jgi:hypothetical protein